MCGIAGIVSLGVPMGERESDETEKMIRHLQY